MVQAVAAALELASANAPVLIVLDDLQWADSSSLSLLRHLFGSGGHLGCLIVGTYRPSDLGPGHPLGVRWQISIASRRCTGSTSVAWETTRSSN